MLESSPFSTQLLRKNNITDLQKLPISLLTLLLPCFCAERRVTQGLTAMD